MAVVTNVRIDTDNARHVLFLAPNLKYAQAVVRNLRKDLEKENIKCTSYSGETKGEPFLDTDHVLVRFVYSDPVEWNNFAFYDYHRIFGEKKLLQTLIKNFPRANYPVASESIQKYIIKVERDDCGKTVDKPKTSYLPEISKIHFNPPMTIVLWEDGTKTTVRCQEGDAYSDEVGLALCIAKKALGNKGNFNNVFRKWVPEREEDNDNNGPTVWFNFDGDKFRKRVVDALREKLQETVQKTVKECITID